MSDRKCGNCLHNIRGTEYIPPCSQCRDYSLWAENPEPSELEQLQAKLATANKQILEYEQAEAAVCPEDVGIKEYVESLLNKLGTAKGSVSGLQLENIALRGAESAALQELATAKAENKALWEALGGSSRIVEKYKDACMEWAKEAQHKGIRQVKEFWERRAKSMANLLIMNQQALKPDKESDHEVGL